MRNLLTVCRLITDKIKMAESCYYVRKVSDIQYDVYFCINLTPSSIDRKVAEFDSKNLADKFVKSKNMANLDLVMQSQCQNTSS